jgi:hypothetical protein
MADVPNQPVARRVEDVVQRHGELDDAKTGSKMTSRDRHGIDGLLPEFGSKLRQLGFTNFAQVFRRLRSIEKWRLRWPQCNVHGVPRPL